MTQTPVAWVAVLTLASVHDGKRHDYATRADAQNVIDRFGHALSIEDIDTPESRQVIIGCASQRGDGGAYRVHGIASALGVPVHIELPAATVSATPAAEPTDTGTPAPATPDATVSEATATPNTPMSASVDRAGLLAGLATVVKHLATRPPVPILSGVLFTTTDTEMIIAGYDYERCTRVRVPASGTRAGSVLIPAAQIHTVVKAFKAPKGATPDTVRIDYAGTGAGTVTVTHGRTVINVPTLPREDYPALPLMIDGAGYVDAEVFAAAALRVAGTAATASAREPLLSNVVVTPTAGGLALLASDSYRAAYDTVPWLQAPACVTVGGAVIPARAIAAVARDAKKAGALAVTFRDVTTPGDRPLTFAAEIAFTYAACTVTLTGATDSFPDMSGHVPSGDERTAIVDGPTLAHAVNAAGIVADHVRFTFTADGMAVAAGPDDPDAGLPTAQWGVDCAHEITPGWSITFPLRTLAKGLSPLKGTLTLGFRTRVQAMTVRSEDAPNAVDLIMPAVSTTATDRHAHADGSDRTPDASDTENTPDGATATPGTTATMGENMTTENTPVTAPETAVQAPAAVAGTPAPIEEIERMAVAACAAMEAHHYGEARELLAAAKDQAPRGYRVAGQHTFATLLAGVNAHERLHHAATKNSDAAPATPVKATRARKTTATKNSDAAPATPVKAHAGVTIRHGDAGTQLTGTPFPLRWKVSAALNSARGGLGWTWDKTIVEGGAWIMDGSAGQPVNSGRIRAAVDAFAAFDCPVTVDVDGYDTDAAPDTTAPARPVPVKATQVARSPRAARTPVAPVSAPPAAGVPVAGLSDEQRNIMIETFRQALAVLEGAPVAASPVTRPAAPVPGAGDAVTYTLAKWSEGDLSYSAARKAVCQALAAAGIRAKVGMVAGNKRAFTVAVADASQRDAADAVIRATVRLAEAVTVA